MYVEITQKSATIDDKLVAYVDVSIKTEKYDYKVRFDEKTKKRFNAFCKKEGFKIGRVHSPPEEKIIYLN